MSLRKKIMIVLGVAAAGAIIYVICCIISLIYTIRRIPEAYAASDTGTLLVEYMKTHTNSWPASWSDLSTLAKTNFGGGFVLRGANGPNYIFTLSNKVAIDWSFKPMPGNTNWPVTRVDGKRFPIVWEGAEPNAMIHDYLNAPRETNRTPVIFQKGSAQSSTLP
jgi:hypothetical protein